MTLAALLPPNSTPLERAVVDALAVYTDPSIIRRYHNPDACPVELLPLLAWERHVDGADAAATPDQLRELIKHSFELHRLRGTPWAVLTALAAIGYPRARLTEWWETTPQGHPGTFRVTLPYQPALANAAEWARIKAAVTAYKNVRSWPEWATVIVPTDDPDALPDDPDAWPVPTVHTHARASATVVAHYNAAPALMARPPAPRLAAALICRYAPAAATLQVAARHGIGVALVTRLGQPATFDAWRPILLTDDGGPLLTDDGAAIEL